MDAFDVTVVGAVGSEFADELLEITPTCVDVSIRCGAPALAR